MYCIFLECELLLSGTAAKKDAVCLASRDPNKLHVQVSRLVNASKTSETHKNQVTCYRSSHLLRAYMKLRSPRWSCVEENTMKALLNGAKQNQGTDPMHHTGDVTLPRLLKVNARIAEFFPISPIRS